MFIVVASGIAIASASTAFLTRVTLDITTRFFVEQDRPSLLLILCLLLMFALLGAPRWRAPGWTHVAYRWPLLSGGLSLAAVAISSWGTFALFNGFDLSIDEVMANFDARIFASGALFAPIPEQWQPFRSALTPSFILPISEPYWASSYLPGNAALRAGVSLILDSGWTSPILLGIAVLCLQLVARRLWPAEKAPQLVAVIVLVTSPQALTMGMTSYAMTAHLALNLLWLVLFLRDDTPGHVGAGLVGWAATGLHQTIFHPLFAMPFVLGLWWQGRRTAALRYAVAYGAMFGFWTLYWKLSLAAAGLSGKEGVDLGLPFFIVRIWWMLSDFSVSGLDLMLKNLLRALSWQNVALLILVPLSWGAIKRGDGIARQLAAGLVLTLAAMIVLLPNQGHGWGYRYIHGLLGNLALLAGYGWLSLASPARDTREAATAFAIASLATILFLLPWRLHQAVGFVLPYRTALEEIRKKEADVVLVDGRRLQYGSDLVRNDPYLVNAPKILNYSLLSPDGVGLLCRDYVVDGFDEADGARLGIQERREPPDPPARLPPVRDMLNRENCRTRPGRLGL